MAEDPAVPPLDLDRIRDRARMAAGHPTWSVAYSEDVPALLAEIERLRRESDEVLDLQRDAMGVEIRKLEHDRDRWREIADGLAALLKQISEPRDQKEAAALARSLTTYGFAKAGEA